MPGLELAVVIVNVAIIINYVYYFILAKILHLG